MGNKGIGTKEWAGNRPFFCPQEMKKARFGGPFLFLRWHPPRPRTRSRGNSKTPERIHSEDRAGTWARQGAEPGGEPRVQLGAYVHPETEKWGKAARDLKVTVD